MVSSGDIRDSHGIAMRPLHLPHSLPSRDVVLQGHVIVGSVATGQFANPALREKTTHIVFITSS